MVAEHVPSSISSLTQLFTVLKSIVCLQAQKSGRPWAHVAELKVLFFERYEESLEEVAERYGYGNDLRGLFNDSKCFSIYGIQRRQDFYVALLEAIVPNCHQSQTQPVNYQIKRSWKIDGKLVKMLRTAGD